jgi:serine phosphatase RsbU (regulator of sigma subunit)
VEPEHAADFPEAIRDCMLENVMAFAQGQPQHDDITMMILKVD